MWPFNTDWWKKLVESVSTGWGTDDLSQTDGGIPAQAYQRQVTLLSNGDQTPDTSLLGQYSGLEIINSVSGELSSDSPLTNMKTKLYEWGVNGKFPIYDANGNPIGELPISLEQAEALRLSIEILRQTPDASGHIRPEIPLGELRMALASATLNDGSPALQDMVAVDQIIQSYVLKNNSLQGPMIDPASTNLTTHLSYFDSDPSTDGNPVGTSEAITQQAQVDYTSYKPLAINPAERLYTPIFSDAESIAATAQFELTFHQISNSDLNEEQKVAYQQIYNDIKGYFTGGNHGSGTLQPGTLLDIPEGIYAAKAMQYLSKGMDPDVGSNEDREQMIHQGILFATLTGKQEFVDRCLWLMEENGYGYQFNPDLQKFQVELVAPHSSLQQEQTVSYIPGMDEANFNNITSGASYGNQPQIQSGIGVA